MNLLSNAIEYNKSGGSVEVSARLQGTSAEIRVKDDGPGISPEDLPQFFQPFYRAGKSRQSDGHLGLVLFLVESHVKAMGGECRVESQLGHGTTFLGPHAARSGAGWSRDWSRDWSHSGVESVSAFHISLMHPREIGRTVGRQLRKSRMSRRAITLVVLLDSLACAGRQHGQKAESDNLYRPIYRFCARLLERAGHCHRDGHDGPDSGDCRRRCGEQWDFDGQ